MKILKGLFFSMTLLVLKAPLDFPYLQCQGARWGSDFDEHKPQPEADLKPILQIKYSRGPDLPQGFQDSHGGFLGNTLITACGFQQGKDKGTRPERYPRGFLKKVWGLDLDHEDSGWLQLPDFPGAARQGLFSAIVDDAVYYWGGFSYSEPYCY